MALQAALVALGHNIGWRSDPQGLWQAGYFILARRQKPWLQLEPGDVMFADMHLAEQLVDDLLLMIAVRTVRKPYGRFHNQARTLFR